MSLLISGDGPVYCYVPTVEELIEASVVSEAGTAPSNLLLQYAKRVYVRAGEMLVDEPAQQLGVELTGQVNRLAQITHTPANDALYTQRSCVVDICVPHTLPPKHGGQTIRVSTLRFNFHPWHLQLPSAFAGV